MFWTSKSKLGVFLPMIMRLLLMVTDQWNSHRSVPGVPEPPLCCNTRYNFERNEILAFKENEKKKNNKKHHILFQGLQILRFDQSLQQSFLL